MPLIDVRGLSKRFRTPVKGAGLAGALRHLVRPRFEEKVAVDGIDLDIEAGERVAYVGPNGAGKSTTVKILTGILHPSAGEVRVCGLVPYQQRIANARNIGVVFGQRTQLWWDLPVVESLRLLGDIYQVPGATFTRTLHDCTALLELGPLLQKPARQLSLGQRMRCDLAAALLHAPPILVLDEPTIGLDVAVKERIRAFIREHSEAEGVTVLLTSHDLGDIENVCQRLVMLDGGRIVFDGPLADVKMRWGRERVVHVLLSAATPDALAIAQAALPELPPAAFFQPEPHQLAVQFDAQQLTAGAIAGRLFPLLPVADLRIDEPGIEQIIRRLYRGELHAQEVA